MFWDELERIDLAMHTGAVLLQVRKSVYHALRAEPDDWGAIAHSGPPKWRTRVSEDYREICGACFADCGQFVRHTRRQQQAAANAKPGGVTLWTCLFCHGHRYTFADSPPPERCRDCGSSRLVRGVWRRSAA